MAEKILSMVLVISLTKQLAMGCSVCKPFVGGEQFQECTSISRTGTETSLDLVVDVASVEIQDWLTLQRRVYNGNLCGPTIRVKKGDTLHINLINNLDEPDYIGQHNTLRYPNTTNIHLHGLHISSKEPSDSVFVQADPGNVATSIYNYTYNINSEQPAGTFWYHAHYHGAAFFQVSSGLSGLLIVEDELEDMPNELKAVSCPENCEHDVEILLQGTMQYKINEEDEVSFIETQIAIQDRFRLDSDVEAWLQDPSNEIDYFTVNGLYKPTLQIELNQLKRFRIANAGGYVGFELEVIKQDTDQAACVIKEIAFDGIYLEQPRDLNFGQTYLSVAARVDWLIYCNETGLYELRSTAKDVNELSIGEGRRYNGTFMTIEVINNKTKQNTNLPTALPDLPSFLQDLRDVTVADENKYVIEFADDVYINRRKFNNSADYRYKMKLDSVQEWTFTNADLDLAHPLHIHVNHFQVISYNTYTGAYTTLNDDGTFNLCSLDGKSCLETKDNNNTAGECVPVSGIAYENYWNTSNEGTLGFAKYGDWRDVLNLPPLADVTVRFRAADYTGTVVIHCHVLKHEDLGMMMVVEVVDQNESTDMANADELVCTLEDGADSLKISAAVVVVWATTMTLLHLLN